MGHRHDSADHETGPAAPASNVVPFDGPEEVIEIREVCEILGCDSDHPVWVPARPPVRILEAHKPPPAPSLADLGEQQIELRDTWWWAVVPRSLLR